VFDLIEFDHVPSEEELMEAEDFSIKLRQVPDESEVARLSSLTCPITLLLTEIPGEKEIHTLSKLSNVANITNVTIWIDNIPTDDEVLRIKNLNLHPQTEKNLCLLLFEIPNYIDRKRIRTVNTLCTTYPFLFLERIPTYEERKDIYLTYPQLGTIIAIEHIPTEEEIVGLSRIKPPPLVGIYLEQAPEIHELKRLSDIKPEVILYLRETPMEDYTSLLGGEIRIEIVSSKGEMINHLVSEAIR
jgi:hypothetical protein